MTSGAGGNASAHGDFVGTAALIGTVDAQGGSSGLYTYGFDAGPRASGGDANASVTGALNAPSGAQLSLTANATGGTGSPGTIETSGYGGAALARASGTTNDFSATPYGTVAANAATRGGYILDLKANTFAPVNGGTSVVESRAAIDRPAAAMSSANNLQAAAFVVGLPRQSDLQAVEAGHANVQSTFGNGETIALIDMATKSFSTTLPGGFQSESFDSQVSMTLFTAQLPELSHLEVGLLDGTITSGSGFESLTFVITVDSSIVESQIFTSLSDAQAYFHDHVLDLGAIDPDSPFLDLSFELTLQSFGGGDGFNGQFVVGAIPEPSTWALLGGAIFLLWPVLRRRHEVA